MTIIAVDFTHCVADGLALDGTIYKATDVQKIRVERDLGMIVALAGTWSMHDVVHRWLCAGAPINHVPQAYGDSSWSALRVSRGGLHVFTSSNPYGERAQPPFAMGADRDMAFGAMTALWDVEKADGSALAAVKLVCDHTYAGGGDIQVVHIEDALGFAMPYVKKRPYEDTKPASRGPAAPPLPRSDPWI